MKASISLLFVFCLCRGFAQDASIVIINTIKAPPPMYLRDAFSSPFDTKPYAGIQGSPFLEDKWTLVKLKVEGRKQAIDSFHIKLNVYDNKIHFIDEKGVELQTTLRVKEIKIIDTASAYVNKIFLSNFDQDAGFFEVIASSDQLKLLKRHRAFVSEIKPLGMETQKNFENVNDLFFYSANTLYKANKNCISIKGSFGADKKVVDYISANHLRCNKEEDMMKIVKFISTLR